MRVFILIAVLNLLMNSSLCTAEAAASATNPVMLTEPMYNGQPLTFWLRQASDANRQKTSAEIIAALVAFFSNDANTQRQQVTAIDALRVMTIDKPEELRPALEALGCNREPYMLCGMAEAMAIRGDALVPVISKVIADCREYGQMWTFNVYVLGVMGAKAKGALPELERVVANEKIPADKRGFVAEMIASIQHDSELLTNGNKSKLIEHPTGCLRPVIESSANQGWSRFHGQDGRNLSPDTGLCTSWPKEGLPLAWTLKGLGQGYSNIALAGEVLFTMGDQTSAEGKRQQCVLAFSLASKTLLWQTPIAPGVTGPFPGPRSTPTIADGRIYALSTAGDLVCLERTKGTVLWRRNLVESYEGKMMSGWLYCESPCVDAGRVIVTPGGQQAVMVALDAITGAEIWKTPSMNFGSAGCDGAAYSSVIVATINGMRQYIQQVGRGVIGVEAATGKLLWHYNRIASKTANITDVQVIGNQVLVSNSYSRGTVLLEIRHNAAIGWQVIEKWFLSPTVFENHHGGIIVLGDYLFGGSGQNHGDPVCIHIPSGQVVWRTPAPSNGSASITYVDGHLVWRYDRGEVYITKATAQGWTITGHLSEDKSVSGARWTHPVVYGGKLFLRHHDVLSVYDVGKVK